MLEIGQRIDRYRLLALLGEGGMGRVYRAHDERLDRDVALKVVSLARADPSDVAELRARLVREARAAAKIDHENAVTVLDVGEVDGVPYIAMELVEGETLRALLGKEPRPLAERVRWLADVARALAHAHQRGIVHRDVKPENVMLRSDGRIKVLDFGIARRISGPVDPTGPTASPALPTLTTAGALVGTTRYMSPEQVRGEALNGQSDQFSWGTMAYELLTGRSPWKGSDALAISASVVADAPPRMVTPGVDPALEGVVLRALEKKHQRRFASMQEVVEALVGWTPEANTDPPAALPAVLPEASLTGYSTEQVSEILRRAVDLQAERKAGLSHDDLVDVAAEVGVDRRVLEQAVKELERQRIADEKTRPARAKEAAKLKRGVVSFAMMCAFFAVLAVTDHWRSWFIWPIVAWGLSLGFAASRYWFPDGVEAAAKKRRADEPEIERGVELLMTATSRRVRVAAEERLRVEEAASEPSEAGDADEPQRARARAPR